MTTKRLPAAAAATSAARSGGAQAAAAAAETPVEEAVDAALLDLLGLELVERLEQTRRHHELLGRFAQRALVGRRHVKVYLFARRGAAAASSGGAICRFHVQRHVAHVQVMEQTRVVIEVVMVAVVLVAARLHLLLDVLERLLDVGEQLVALHLVLVA